MSAASHYRIHSAGMGRRWGKFCRGISEASLSPLSLKESKTVSGVPIASHSRLAKTMRNPVSHVVHVTSWLSRQGGGVWPVIWNLARHTGQLGINCSVAGLKDHWLEADCSAQSSSLLCGAIIGPRSFGYSRGLYDQVRSLSDRRSIVHSHGLWMHPGVIARKCAHKAGCPLVVSPHGMLDPWALKHSRWKKKLAGWFFENKNLRSAACLHALCESEARAIREFGLRNPICIIPNAMDLPANNDPGHEFTGPLQEIKKDGRKILLYLGRLHPKKGLINLIRAWAKVKSTEWVLAIAGWDQGGHEAELKSICQELDVPCTNSASPVSVCFLGPQFDGAKSACYSACDAFVLPSVSEGLPMVILEAWAYAKPVLMTPQCNLPEGFKAKAAIQIEPIIESITTGLQSLFRASAAERDELGRNGRNLVAERFNWPKCAAEMVHVYHWLLGSGSKPACVADF